MATYLEARKCHDYQSCYRRHAKVRVIACVRLNQTQYRKDRERIDTVCGYMF